MEGAVERGQRRHPAARGGRMSTRRSACPVELVWDRGCAGTAQAASGSALEVAPEGAWTPEQLLVAAIEASLLISFMELAADDGLEVLGYVSAATRLDDPGADEIVVRPCVTVGRTDERARVERVLARALERSPIARALRPAVRVEADVIALGDEPG
jgi:organic hydroperoxide reductase OsmC/OhrA